MKNDATRVATLSGPQTGSTSQNRATARLAVLIPCHNEEMTIGSVVSEFRAELPEAEVFVFDNNSSDRTAEIAVENGARVYYEPKQGKGNVVQAMFRQIDADIYLMVDGDGTYPARFARELIAPVAKGDADMVIGSRLHTDAKSEFKSLNRIGNRLYLLLLRRIFGVRLTDLLSGYRAFSRSLVKSMPLFEGGFQTEVEMTIKALERRYRVAEIPVDLGRRPEGSYSKIRIFRDGFAILSSMIALLRDYKPLTFFGGIGIVLGLTGLLPGAVVVVEYMRTGLVGRTPSALLAVGLVLSGLIMLVVGIILHTVASRFRELDRQLHLVLNELRRQPGDDDR